MVIPFLNQVVAGDCLELAKQLPDGCAQLQIHDPPYGIAFRGRKYKGRHKYQRILNDDSIFTGWLQDSYRIAAAHSAMYVFCDWRTLGDFKAAAERAGWRASTAIIWDKGVHAIGDLDGVWAPRYEMILYCIKGRVARMRQRRQNIISLSKLLSSRTVHPNQKPVELVELLIALTSRPGDLIVDFFAGSGTTGAAAAGLGRNFILFEMDDQHHGVAQRRLSHLQRPLLTLQEASPCRHA